MHELLGHNSFFLFFKGVFMKRRSAYALGLAMFFHASFVWAQAFEIPASHAVLMEAETGSVLFEKNADQPMVPSSMTKLMTLYILFDHLKSGKVKLDDSFLVSEKAWRTGGSKMFVHVGDSVKVEDLMRGIIVQSGNDATVVVAEGLASTEEAFANLMNQTAERLVLTQSHFKNASGLPEDGHVMSARDLALLGERLVRDFPDYFHYFAEKEFTYNKITQGNRNLLLDDALGVDGLKTGHTEEAGYGITISAKQGERRLIGVVNGLSSVGERAEEAKRLLVHGFKDFDTVTLYHAGDVIGTAPVWFGALDTVALVVQEDVRVTLPTLQKDAVKAELAYRSPLVAPLRMDGDSPATLVLHLPSGDTRNVPLRVSEDVEKAGFFRHMLLSAKYRLGAL